MRTLDRLNLRFGHDTVTFAVADRKGPWTMQRARFSPCYTTAWNDLLRV
jgi:DNA polymerase V